MDSAQKNRLVPVLVVLLVVAAFLLGHLYTKVQFLEKGTLANAGQVAGTNNQVPPEQPPNTPVDVEFADAPVMGNPQAKVAIVEFTDYQCPFCGQLFTNTFPQVKKEYIDTGKVKFYSRDFPLNAIHPQAQKAAEAAQCAKDQNKFWEFHDKMFANQTALSIDDLKKYAVELGLNAGTFNTCLDNGTYKDKVANEIKEAEKIGVRGTPASFVGVVEGNKMNGIQISGAVPFESFKTEIEAALAKVQ